MLEQIIYLGCQMMISDTMKTLELSLEINSEWVNSYSAMAYPAHNYTALQKKKIT